MKLDRNINPDRKGKYAIIKLRVVSALTGQIHAEVIEALRMLEDRGVLDFGGTPDTDFFVIRLKDKYSAKALIAYAGAAENEDSEYAEQVAELATMALNYPHPQMPN